ncbi:hypothetical protein RRG08_034355 [Elysia crispata]|uniref:Uncharacterized protein n=1 Tax=Elysia crispata TaxID=231223 RepID=A0AAE0YD17_9GAST|nr:hypothetical protein RRG08_034355 [Elysia crispata]
MCFYRFIQGKTTLAIIVAELDTDLCIRSVTATVFHKAERDLVHVRENGNQLFALGNMTGIEEVEVNKRNVHEVREVLNDLKTVGVTDVLRGQRVPCHWKNTATVRVELKGKHIELFLWLTATSIERLRKDNI